MMMSQNQEYLKEKNEFYYLLNLEKQLVKSDGENYLIGQGDKKYPIWLWSKNNLKKEKIEEIKEILEKDYFHEGENTIIGKKELYEGLSQNFSITDYFEMGFLECENLKEYKNVPGVFAKANYGDKVTLSKFYQVFFEEIEHEKIDLKDSLEEVTKWLREGNFYVWKDHQGKVMSMASYTIEKDVAKLSHVYTKQEERNKGYCTSLIYHLTKMLLEENLHPILYTDYHYGPSNASYKRVGYEEKDVLVRFKICI